MGLAQNAVDPTTNSSSGRDLLYWVVVSVPDSQAAEERIQQVVERSRGDLKGLMRRTPQDPARLQLRLGVRRIDDVLAALEGAGFDVQAVIATSVRR